MDIVFHITPLTPYSPKVDVALFPIAIIYYYYLFLLFNVGKGKYKKKKNKKQNKDDRVFLRTIGNVSNK
jgi:hypothetical protein